MTLATKEKRVYFGLPFQENTVHRGKGGMTQSARAGSWEIMSSTQTRSRASELEPGQNYKHSNTTTSEVIPSVSLDGLKVPKPPPQNCDQLQSKCSNTWACGGHLQITTFEGQPFSDTLLKTTEYNVLNLEAGGRMQPCSMFSFLD